MKLKWSSKKMGNEIKEMPIIFEFPSEYWIHICTYNVTERQTGKIDAALVEWVIFQMETLL